MSHDHSFDDLLVRLRAGEEAAAADVFDRFTQQLIAKAQSRMSRAVRQKVDAEDVVQSVYRSFFTRFKDGQFELEPRAATFIGKLLGRQLQASRAAVAK